MTTRQVGIVVPAHGYVTDFFDSVAVTEAEYCEILIVDDCSDLKDAAKIQDVCAEMGWEYLRNRDQQLFTRTVNRGMRALSPNLPWLCECNTDIVVFSGWLNALMAMAESDPGIGVAGYEEKSPGPEQIHDFYVPGHCVLYRRQMLEGIGVLNEQDIGGPGTLEGRMPFGCAHWGSDREICERAREHGWQTWRRPHYSEDKVVLIKHEHPGTSTRNDRNWVYGFDVTTLWKARSAL